MDKLSDRVKRLGYSQTFVMSNKAREMKASGIDVISLTLGEPDFDVPDNIKQAAFDAIQPKLQPLLSCSGIPELREAIAYKLKETTIWNTSLLKSVFPMVPNKLF
jgi:aspartate aminotransferase